jgi:hypothetical protein
MRSCLELDRRDPSTARVFRFAPTRFAQDDILLERIARRTGHCSRAAFDKIEILRSAEKRSAQDDAYVCGRARSCENILGHVEILVTQNVPESLRPCGFAQASAEIHA